VEKLLTLTYLPKKKALLLLEKNKSPENKLAYQSYFFIGV
jgi:hypothetical protein